MVFVKFKLCGNLFCNIIAVTGEHNCFFNAGCLKCTDCFGSIGLNRVRNNDVPGIFPVNRNMNDCTCFVTAFC